MHLGIDDFQYSDLYDFSRLTELATAFDRFVGENDAVAFEARQTRPHEVEQHLGDVVFVGVLLTQPVEGRRFEQTDDRVRDDPPLRPARTPGLRQLLHVPAPRTAH